MSLRSRFLDRSEVATRPVSHAQLSLGFLDRGALIIEKHHYMKYPWLTVGGWIMEHGINPRSKSPWGTDARQWARQTPRHIREIDYYETWYT